MKKLITLFFFMLTIAASTEAAIPPYADPIFSNKPITLQISKMGARDVIESMLDQTQFAYVLPDSLSNSTKISIDAHNTAWSYVFKLVVDRAGFSYSVSPEGEVRLYPKE